MPDGSAARSPGGDGRATRARSRLPIRMLLCVLGFAAGGSPLPPAAFAQTNDDKLSSISITNRYRSSDQVYRGRNSNGLEPGTILVSAKADISSIRINAGTVGPRSIHMRKGTGSFTSSFPQFFDLDVGTNDITVQTRLGSSIRATYIYRITRPGAIVLSRGQTLTMDEGETAEYTVRLIGAPTGNVVVGVSSSDAAAAGVAPTSLTFGTTNWSAGQTVTVTGQPDLDQDSESVTITHAVNDGQSTSEYRSAPDRRLTVHVVDDDAGLTVSPQAVMVTEGGAGASYTVALDAEPTGPVTVSPGTVPEGR